MGKRAKSKDYSKHNEVRRSVQVPQLCSHPCSLKLRAPSELLKLGSKNADTTPGSAAGLRKKRKRKYKNVHLKAVTKKSLLEINTLGCSPSTQKSWRNRKPEACNEHLKDNYTAGKSAINGLSCESTVDKVSFQPKVLLKAWPCRSSESKDCSVLMSKQSELYEYQPSNKSLPSHRCFDFSNGSTVRACCLSCEDGFWVSADPRIPSRVEHKPIGSRVVARKANPEASRNTISVPSTSTETSGHSELPGFYFDPEKKRFFKIVSSSYNCMSNVVTRERIALNRNEKLRQEELQFLASTGHLKDPKHQTTVRKMASFLTLIDRTQRGIIRQEESAYQLRRSCIAKLRPHAGKQFVDSPGAIIQQMRISAKENQLLICHSVQKETSISLMKINGFRCVPNGSGDEDERRFSVDLQEECNDILGCPVRCVSDLSFAMAGSALAVLHCANSHFLNTSSIFDFTRIVKSPPNPTQHELLIAKHVKSYLMCCATTNDFFAVGTECNVLLCNYANCNSIVQLNTSRTAIHALTFANTSSNVLFCAAKNGKILMFDKLSSRRKPVAFLAQPEGFSCDLYMTKDDRCLLSAKYNGQSIEKWDLRQGRVVVEYPGHISECIRTRLVVDQREEFLSSVGSDSYTRIWDVKTGELMKVLPPPLPATKENRPSVCFVDLYGDSRNNYPGLLLGMSDELHFYSL